jgi:hypothetical protein
MLYCLCYPKPRRGREQGLFSSRVHELNGRCLLPAMPREWNLMSRLEVNSAPPCCFARKRIESYCSAPFHPKRKLESNYDGRNRRVQLSHWLVTKICHGMHHPSNLGFPRRQLAWYSAFGVAWCASNAMDMEDAWPIFARGMDL